MMDAIQSASTGWRRIIERKLAQIHAVLLLSDLAIFPGNRLEALKGDRAGQHSIGINDQYRICFVWRNGNAFEVEIAALEDEVNFPSNQAYPFE